MVEAILNGSLEWQNPLWLWGVLVPVLWLWWQHRQTKQQQNRYADAHLWPWVNAQTQQGHDLSKSHLTAVVNRFVTKNVSAKTFLIIGWVLLILALAGPRALDKQASLERQTGVDILLSLDLSRSMLAQDIKPNRFTFAKSLIESLANQIEAKHRLGLSVFAGQPHLALPITLDKTVFKQTLNTVYPGLLPTQGSWLDLALLHDSNLLKQSPSKAKVLIMFSDGAPVFWKPKDKPEDLPKVFADLQLSLGLQPGQKVKNHLKNIRVIYVGVGSEQNTTIKDSEHPSKKLHVNGLLVQTKLEQRQLQRLAQKTNGIYLKADSSGAFTQQLLAEINAVAKEQAVQNSELVWRSFAQFFVMAALLCLLTAFYGWSLIAALKTVLSSKNATKLSVLILAGVTSIVLVSYVPFVKADDSKTGMNSNRYSLEQGYSEFNQKNYAKALTHFDHFSNFNGFFGAGSSAYELGDLEAAVLYSRQAAWLAKTDKLRAKALFNLGNSYYQSNLLAPAIEVYQQALIYDANHAKAKMNLKLAQARFKLENPLLLVNNQQDQSSAQKGRDNDGAFYGGQKPNADGSNNEIGADSDLHNGQGKAAEFELPQMADLTNYDLNPSIAKLQLNQSTNATNNSAVLQKQRNWQRANKFKHKLQQLKENRAVFYKRLFEREEGFEAAQDQAHAIDGVQPW